MTFQAIRDGAPLRAAAVVGAFTDLDVLMKSDPETYKPLIAAIWPDFDAHRDEILTRRSAVRWAERFEVPLLIMHGGRDKGVDRSHTLALADRLEALGKPYRLIIFGGGNHVIARQHEERDRSVIEWFKEHMGASR